MAFVASFTPVAARSSFTNNATDVTPNPLHLGCCRRTPTNATAIRMGTMSSYTRQLLFSSKGKDYTYSNPTWTPATAASPTAVVAYVPSSRAGAPRVFQYVNDATCDTVKPAGAYKADSYMATCVKNQYKTMANPAGVYSSACTEGTTKLQADEARELANLNEFRMMQRSSVKTYSDYFENRKQAIKLAHGCHHEEVQVSNMPSVARAMIRGYSEAKSICVRYNTGIEYVQECGNETQIASAYMAKCVDAQYKQLACPTGEYAGTCAEGNTAGLADFKRVQALSARFRANQMSTIAKTQAKYDAKLFARSMFRTCNYEEDYNAYPAVAAAMRGLSS